MTWSFFSKALSTIITAIITGTLLAGVATLVDVRDAVRELNVTVQKFVIPALSDHELRLRAIEKRLPPG